MIMERIINNTSLYYEHELGSECVSSGAWAAGVYKHVFFLTKSITTKKIMQQKKNSQGMKQKFQYHGFHQIIDDQCGFRKSVEQKL